MDQFSSVFQYYSTRMLVRWQVRSDALPLLRLNVAHVSKTAISCVWLRTGQPSDRSYPFWTTAAKLLFKQVGVHIVDDMSHVVYLMDTDKA